MYKKKILGLLLSFFVYGLVIADTVKLNPNHPDKYVVVKGDTLWDISSMFLRDPSGNALEFKAFCDIDKALFAT